MELGRWDGGIFGEVMKMLSIHGRLSEGYRLLVLRDGKASLKAKRIVRNILRRGGNFSTMEAVEVGPWWARSKSYVEKMEEMNRLRPETGERGRV